MNKKTILIILSIGIGLFLLPSVLSQNGNEEIIKMKAIQVAEFYNSNQPDDENFTSMGYLFKFTITVNASGSYTYTYSQVEPVDVLFDNDKPKKYNETIIKAVQNIALQNWNYNLSGKKIMYHPFEQGYN